MQKKIFGLTYINENQVLDFATESYRSVFEGYGSRADILNLSKPADVNRLQTELRSDQVEFCFALQGVGSRLTLNSGENIWTHFKTPFIALHHDNPCCNIYNHFCDSFYVANLYLFRCHLDIQRHYVKSPTFDDWLPYETGAAYHNVETRFRDRPHRLMFLKSGKSPLLCADQINQIRRPLRDAIWAAIDQASQNENLVICDLLQEAFAACGYDYRDFLAEFWGFAGLIEGYIRTKRAADLVEWLKFQPGAIIIGDGWDFIDKTGAKALFKPSIPGSTSPDLYSQTQFILNTSPYGSDIIHERVTLGLGHRGFVLSDTNAWWDEHFSDVPSLFRFRWNTNLDEQLQAALHDPHAAEKAESGLGSQRVNEKLGLKDQIPSIINIALRVRSFAKSMEDVGLKVSDFPITPQTVTLIPLLPQHQ